MNARLIPALLLTLLISARLPLAASENTTPTPVGVLRVRIDANERKLLSLPFLSFGESVTHAIQCRRVEPGSGVAMQRILKWDASRQEYEEAVRVEEDGRWFSTTAFEQESDMALLPGDAFWLVNHSESEMDVFLCGQVVLDQEIDLTMASGVTLFGYPFSSARPITEQDAFFGRADRAADTLSTIVAGRYVPAIATGTGVVWRQQDGASFPAMLEMGSGYAYERVPDAPLSLVHERPYEDPALSQGFPVVTGIEVSPESGSVHLAIRTAGEEQGLDILYKDLSASDELNTTADWRLADSLPRDNVTDVVWNDDGGDERPTPLAVEARYYLVTRSIDSDGDGLADARERFIHGTAATHADTDQDGISDDLELELNTEPTTFDDMSALRAELQRSGRLSLVTKESTDGTVLFVDRKSGDDSFSGRVGRRMNFDGPKRTVGAAVVDARDNDTIVVRAGNYGEHLNIAGKDVSVRIVGNVRLAGRRSRAVLTGRSSEIVGITEMD